MGGQAPLLIGEWQVYPALDELRRDDRLVKLEPRLMRLLCVLAERPGEVCSTEDLLDRAWPGVVVGPASIYQAVGQLRRALGDSGDEPRYVATISRKGYRLIAPVRPLEPLSSAAAGAAPAADAASPAAPADRPDSAPSSLPAARRPRARVVVVALAAVAALGLAAWWYARPAPREFRVAVIPFTDLSPDGSAQAFAGGLGDELAAGLARLPHVRVTATSSARSTPEDAASARRRATAAGVDYVLEGSVRTLQGRVRISAQLVDARDGFQVWANSYDRTQAAALATQTEIAAAITDSLRLQFAPDAPVRIAEADTGVSAYDLYLLGRRQQLLRQHEAIDRAIAYYRRALTVDPRFALAHAGLADAYLGSMYYQARPLAEVAPLVEQAAAKALELDSGLAEGYAARGLLRVEQWRIDEAIADLQHALAINPALGEAYLRLGMANEYRARPREALAAYDELLTLDPLHTQVNVRRCLVLTMLARYADAEPGCARARELQPELPNPIWMEGLLHYLQGDTAGSIRAYERALARAPHRADLRRDLAWLHLDLGMPEAAAREAASARDNGRPGDMEVEVTGLYVRLARGDAAGVRRTLAAAEWVATTDLSSRLAFARLAHLAGADARAIALQPGDARERVPRSMYLLSWGYCEPCTLASVERAFGVDAPRAGDVDAWLADAVAAGYRTHGLEYVLALRAAERGDRVAALAGLERAYAAGWRRAWLMRIEPALAPLRELPRFRVLLERIDRDNAAARATLQRAPDGATSVSHTPTRNATS